jgi:hypothetical protein
MEFLVDDLGDFGLEQGLNAFDAGVRHDEGPRGLNG